MKLFGLFITTNKKHQALVDDLKTAKDNEELLNAEFKELFKRHQRALVAIARLRGGKV